MFPIRNVKGHVIGFGARTFKKDEQPKYINSPETPIYHKGRELYGLFEGREFIHRKGRAIVCEGYMDVIQLSQAGFEESVAALGTSITSEHVQKLLKISDQVYFSFDGDAAGRKAARRALEAALPVITDVQKAAFILLPPEHDPDSLIKAEGPEAFEREIRRALGLVDFAKSLLLDGKDLLYAEDRAKVVAEGKAFALQMTKAPMLRLALIEEIAAIARVSTKFSASTVSSRLLPRWRCLPRRAPATTDASVPRGRATDRSAATNARATAFRAGSGANTTRPNPASRSRTSASASCSSFLRTRSSSTNFPA